MIYPNLVELYCSDDLLRTFYLVDAIEDTFLVFESCTRINETNHELLVLIMEKENNTLKETLRNYFKDCGKASGFFFQIKDFSSRNQYLSIETKIIVLAFLERLACQLRLFHNLTKNINLLIKNIINHKLIVLGFFRRSVTKNAVYGCKFGHAKNVE